MISHDRWQVVIERADEVVMMVKTRASLADAVSAAVKELHSYKTSAIMVLPNDRASPGVYPQRLRSAEFARGRR
jgi:uncharacterized protein involved in tolerance to divalent cations